jgi:hypothetical protein
MKNIKNILLGRVMSEIFRKRIYMDLIGQPITPEVLGVEIWTTKENKYARINIAGGATGEFLLHNKKIVGRSLFRDCEKKILSKNYTLLIR